MVSLEFRCSAVLLDPKGGCERVEQLQAALLGTVRKTIDAFRDEHGLVGGMESTAIEATAKAGTPVARFGPSEPGTA